MTDRATLLALASRVEAATGADRGLDSEIHHAKCGGVGTGSYGTEPRYTASLDAAMSLVPSMDCADWDEGIVPAYFSLSRSTTWESGPMQRGWAAILHPVTHETIAEARASTPALALTAACLRARAMLEQDNG